MEPILISINKQRVQIGCKLPDKITEFAVQHKLREDIRRLTVNIECHFKNPYKEIHVAVWRAVRDIRRRQFRKLFYS